jgi:hypothetical protein
MSVPGLDDDRDSFIRGSCRSFDPQLCALILCAESASQIVAQGNALGYRDHGIFALKGHNKTSARFFGMPLQGGNLF